MENEMNDRKEYKGVRPILMVEGTLSYYICGVCLKKIVDPRHKICLRCKSQVDWSEVRDE